MKKKILIIITILLLTTGCAKRFEVKVDDNVKKSYVSNILCLPEKKELLNVYIDNPKELKKVGVNINKLPTCNKMKINSNGYQGLWTSLFVKPLSWLIIKLGLKLKNYGWSIMILGLALRLLMLPFSLKSVNMSKNMQKAQKDLERLEKKYSNKNDKDSLMMKNQEMLLIYKKYDIKPLSGCLTVLLQTPIFFAFLEAIYRVPAFFEQNFWKFNLGSTPLEGFKTGNYWYIILIVLIAITTYLSFKNVSTPTLQDNQASQTKNMSTIMIVMIIFASFSLPAAIALYWVVSNGFAVIQNYIVKKKGDN